MHWRKLRLKLKCSSRIKYMRHRWFKNYHFLIISPCLVQKWQITEKGVDFSHIFSSVQSCIMDSVEFKHLLSTNMKMMSRVIFIAKTIISKQIEVMVVFLQIGKIHKWMESYIWFPLFSIPYAARDVIR